MDELDEAIDQLEELIEWGGGASSLTGSALRSLLSLMNKVRDEVARLEGVVEMMFTDGITYGEDFPIEDHIG